jgi:transcriptional regulator with XRE-family HTH domain
MRNELGMTITTVAGELGQWVSIISRLERGYIRNDELAANYRQWLKEQAPGVLGLKPKDASLSEQGQTGSQSVQ